MFVDITEGTLKGEKLKNVLTSEDFYSFKGIPFAKPPVGSLRFKDPVIPEKYEGVWDATQERSMCLQTDWFNHSSLWGDEDCLYLNVFTPQVPNGEDSLKPVMFYIHWGGFKDGQKDCSWHSPDFLVAKDIILVVPNYRLHVFGFLNLGIQECSGNVGLKDQIAALKWTQRNISQFGGDPNNITIFGNSCGAASVMFLLYSPLSRGKGLFHKAIIQSGNIMHNRCFITVEESIERVSRAAKKLGFASKDPQELYNFLMEVPAADLTVHAVNILTQEEKNRGDIHPFLPTVEVTGSMDERMIPVQAMELIKQDPGVPVMTGVCSQEALYLLHGLIKGKRPFEEFMSRVESAIIPRLFRDLINDEETEENVVNEFKKFYFHGKSTYEETVLSAIDLFGDLMYNKGFYDSTKALLKNSSQPVYCYLFSYRAKLGELEYMLNYNRPSFIKGAGHGDELAYLYNMVIFSSTNDDKASLGKSDREMIELMTTIWTNFAKNGNPGEGLPVDFKRLTSIEKSYLNIDEELTIKPGFIFEERMKFIDAVHLSLTEGPQ